MPTMGFERFGALLNLSASWLGVGRGLPPQAPDLSGSRPHPAEVCKTDPRPPDPNWARIWNTKHRLCLHTRRPSSSAFLNLESPAYHGRAGAGIRQHRSVPRRARPDTSTAPIQASGARPRHRRDKCKTTDDMETVEAGVLPRKRKRARVPGPHGLAHESSEATRLCDQRLGS